MTVNSNLEAAWKYHNTSKHSYASVHNNPHFLDWSNQPLPFKAYTTLEPLRLPREVRQTGVAALSAIAESIHLEAKVGPDLEALAQLRSEEHTSELQSHSDLVCRLLLEKKKEK